MADVDQANDLAGRLIAARLVTEEQVAECRAALKSAGADGGDEPLAGEFRRRGLLTAWQLQQVRGGHGEFLLEHGRYLLLDQIGQGGMGAVYKARHTRMQRSVALKVIDPRRVTDAGLINRFRREVEVCSRLQHEHVVQAYDVGEHNGTTFLVLEFVEGSNLADLVRRDGPMAAEEAAAVCVQVAAGLDYAHRQGIIHRDIKPQNVLVSIGGVTKILDMGLARVEREAADSSATDLTQDGAMMGTVDYMPPEQARNAHLADARSDLYSLGATLYFLLAGKPPFPGGSTIEKLHRLAVEAPPPIRAIRPDCPDGLAQVVERLMQKDPALRYPSAGDAVRALRPFAAERIAGRPVVTAGVQTAADTMAQPEFAATIEQPAPFLAEDHVATVMSRVHSDREKDARRTKWIAGGAAAFVAVLAAIGFWAGNRGGKPEDDSPPDPPSVAPQAVAPSDVRMELPGHFDGVICFGWSPDEKLIATGGGDGDVRIWDVATGKEQGRCIGHRGTVVFVAFSPDSKHIASADSRGEVRVWDWREGRIVADAKRPPAPGWPHKLVFSPDGREVAFLAHSQVIRLQLATGRAGDGLRVKEVPIDMTYSRDGKRLAIATAKGRVDVWDLATSRRTPLLPPGDKLNVIATAHDGTLAVAEHGRVRFLDMKSGREVRGVVIPPVLDRRFTPQFQNRPHAQFVNEGRSIVLGTTQRGGLIVDFSSGTKRTIAVPFNGASPSSHFTVHLGGLYVNLYRATAAKLLRRFAHSGVRRCPAYVVGDRYLRVARFRDLTVDLAAGRELKLPPYAYVDDGGMVWWVQDGIVQRARIDLLSLRSQKVCELQSIDGYRPDRRLPATGFRWSDDGTRIFAAARDDKSVRVWNATDGTIIQTLQISTDRLRQDFTWFGPAANHNASTFAFTGTPSTVVIRRTDSGRPATVEAKTELNGVYGGLGVSPDGGVLFQTVGPGGGGEIFTLAWDIQANRRIWKTVVRGTQYGDSPQVVVSRSGRFVMVLNSILEARTGKRVWAAPERDHASGASLSNRQHTPHRYGDFFPDDRHAVIVHDNQYQIWDFQNNKRRATVYALPGGQWALVNHETGHIAGSPSALQYLRFGRKIDKTTFWLTPAQYEKQHHWKPDPKRAGLKFRAKPAQP